MTVLKDIFKIPLTYLITIALIGFALIFIFYTPSRDYTMQKIVVLDSKTNTAVYECTGQMIVDNSPDLLEIEILDENGKPKHFTIGLNSDNIYIIEDVSTDDYSTFSYYDVMY